jgi:hypothetical protein
MAKPDRMKATAVPIAPVNDQVFANDVGALN